VILDGERIAWCNDNASLHLGIDPVRDVGNTITHLVRIPEFRDYLAAGDFARPIQVLAGQGDQVLSLQVIAYGEDQRLVLSRDVTQFRKVEQVRREFVANVSHELRTPLTVVAGFLETLRDETDADAARRYIDLMSEQARRMQRLVEDLLTLSALESSPPPPMEEPVEMRGVLERLGAEARALSGGRHQVEVTAEEGIGLLGSEKELSSAFGNLVSNAIRYTEEGGIVVGCRRRAGHLRIEVYDTGIGISPEEHRAIFREFYQVPGGRRPGKSMGMGLGLAIVAGLAQALEHPVTVASTPGKGSVFALTVPLGVPIAAVSEPEPPAMEELQGRMILVIDDEEDIQAAVAEVLTRWGCHALTAASGDDAVAALREHGVRPDAMVVDYQLADGESGLDAIASVESALGARLPAIIVTGDTRPERLREAREIGHLLLYKPLAPMRLRAALTSALLATAAA